MLKNRVFFEFGRKKSLESDVVRNTSPPKQNTVYFGLIFNLLKVSLVIWKKFLGKFWYSARFSLSETSKFIVWTFLVVSCGFNNNIATITVAIHFIKRQLKNSTHRMFSMTNLHFYDQWKPLVLFLNFAFLSNFTFQLSKWNLEAP